MWTAVDLPFQNTNTPLPLPTMEQIRACTNVVSEFARSNIAIIDENVIVKYGPLATVAEGQALIYLERYCPEIPAPRLYAMYCDGDETFLIMQRVPGLPLKSIWPSLEPLEKADIVVKLKHIFKDLRKAECPWPDFYGGIDGGSIKHPIFFSEGEYLGPFAGGAAFVGGLISSYRSYVQTNKWPDYKLRYYERYIPQVLGGHKPTLTHSDVQQKNIMVTERPERLSKQGGRSFDVVLVDWESAGWYPDFWEFFQASSRMYMGWDEDWSWQLQEFLPVFPAEKAMMDTIERDLYC